MNAQEVEDVGRDEEKRRYILRGQLEPQPLIPDRDLVLVGAGVEAKGADTRADISRNYSCWSI